MKDKILKILEDHQLHDSTGDEMYTHPLISHTEYDNIADSIVKLFSIHIVSNSVVSGSFIYLHTIGDGSDGSEWQVIGIYHNYKKAYREKKKYKFRSKIERWRVD